MKWWEVRGEGLRRCGLENEPGQGAAEEPAGRPVEAGGNQKMMRYRAKSFAKGMTGRDWKTNCSHVKMLQRSESSSQWPLFGAF